MHGRCAVWGDAELAIFVVSPTAHYTVVHERAGMPGARGNGLHAREYVAGWWGRKVRCCAIAELATAVSSPTAHATRFHERTCVTAARGDGLHIREHIAGWWGRTARRCAVAELAVLVVSPTAHTAVRHESAGVTLSSCSRYNLQSVGIAASKG